MPITKEQLETVLKSYFPNGEIKITDLAGDNDHWSAEIVDTCFNGLPRIAQHKMVQKAVAEYQIHALQIKTSGL